MAKTVERAAQIMMVDVSRFIIFPWTLTKTG